MVDDTEEVDVVDVGAFVAEDDMEVTESAVLLNIEDLVVIAEPIASVVGAGGVVISAAGTVTFLKATPVLV